MNKIKLAQALVPVADELDERGLVEEAVELDEVIEELMSQAASEYKMEKQSQAMYGRGNPGVPKFAPVKGGPPAQQWNSSNPVIGQPAPQWNPNKPVSSTMALQNQMQQAQAPATGNWTKGPQAPGNVESVQMQWKNPQQQQDVFNQLQKLKTEVANIDNQLMSITGGNPDNPQFLSNPQVQQLRQTKMMLMRQGAQLRTQYELPMNNKGSYGNYQNAYNLNRVPQV